MSYTKELPTPSSNVLDSGSAPTVSVLCHCYNHEPYIRQTLDQILNQETDFPIEIIIHDDASTDRSQEIIGEVCADQGQRATAILQNKNQFSQGRRPPFFTFPHIRGEFTAICEGDDYWVDRQKLQKQVDALRRYPNIDLCVHPAIRQSIRTGKQKRCFDYGSVERIIEPAQIIARHNQFAPTASIVTRTNAIKALPDWFLNEPDLPIGDCFLEAILGRKGALYLPQAMSVYRRGVPGSHTDSFLKSDGHTIGQSLTRMLHYTERLRELEGINANAIEKRLTFIRLNHALQSLAIGNHTLFEQISREIQLHNHIGITAPLTIMRKSRLAFNAGRALFLHLHRIQN